MTWRAVLHELWLRATGVPPCVSCGLCCAPAKWTANAYEDARGFVDLKRRDAHRLRRGERREFLAPVEPPITRYRQTAEGMGIVQKLKLKPARPDGRRNMLMVLNDAGHAERCSALRGTVGEHVSCAVYARRSDACRDWPRGGARCRWVLWRSRMPECARAGAGRYPYTLDDRWWQQRPPWILRKAVVLWARVRAAVVRADHTLLDDPHTQHEV